MKKLITFFVALMLLVSSTVLFACDKPGKTISTVLPETSYKATVIFRNTSVLNSEYTKEITYIQGEFGNRKVVYIKTVTDWDNSDVYDNTLSYLVVSDEGAEITSTTATVYYCYYTPSSPAGDPYWKQSSSFSWNDYKSSYGDYYEKIALSAWYPDSDLISENETEYVYRYYRDYDIVHISKDESNYIISRVQGNDASWQCNLIYGSFIDQIPEFVS